MIDSNLRFDMINSLLSNVSRMSILLGGKKSDGSQFAVCGYAGSPRLSSAAPRDPQKFAGCARVAVMVVLLVNAWRYVAQVAPAVVITLTVEVIDLVFRPFSGHKKPSDAVGVVSLPHKGYASSSVCSNGADRFSGLYSASVSDLPRKNSCLWTVVKELIGLFKSKFVHIGVCTTLALLYSSATPAQDVRKFVPAQAAAYQPTLKVEMDEYWPGHPMPETIPALIEHESGCFGMPIKCWNPKSRFKTAREEGAGLGQLTRAWRPDGSLRFDALAEMRQVHPGLKALNWSNIYSRPDLQIRALILKVRGDYMGLRVVTDPLERLAFADAAYNGGLGGVHKERRACGLTAGCDPQRWFGHVERTCLKSRVALYAGRSACDINRHHVTDVLLVRSPKYRGWLS